MTSRNQGPRRAQSVRSYLRQTRLLAILAVIALAAGIASDATEQNFWVRHALLAGLVASVIVVMLSVAVVNEVLERRRRQRWSVLAQYVMIELVRNARMIWMGVLDETDLPSPSGNQQEDVDASAEIVRDTPRLATAVRATLEDDVRRSRLHSEISFLAQQSDEVLGRWAGVMLNAEVYAEIIDRHVELAGDIAWIGSLLDTSHPPGEARRERRARSNPATQIQPELDSGWLADRIVVIAQLAESLDRGTLELALRIVPVEWWEARLATAPPADRTEGRG
jgi:hypothetical protein